MTLSNDIQTVESRCATTKQNPDILDNLDIMTSIHLRCSSPREFLRTLVAKERFLPADPLLNNWTFFRIANESWRTPKCPATGRVRCKLFGRKIQEDEEQQLSSSSRILRCQLVYFGALEVVRHMVTCFVMFWHCEWLHISTPPSNQQSDRTVHVCSPFDSKGGISDLYNEAELERPNFVFSFTRFKRIADLQEAFGQICRPHG
jgi:hypothetical protein